MKDEIRMTKDEWPEVRFGDIFDISSSKRVLESQWKTSGVPFYRAREIVRLARDGSVQNELFISEELYREYKSKYGVPKPGDLMISAVGTLGACYVVQPSDRFYFKDASVLRFSPKQAVCPRFIQHAFGTNHILDQVNAGSGSTVGTYTISRANETRIPLPPLAEQRRIAEVLDRAEALRAKRRAALAELDSLTQSLFLDLFGDPVTNPKGWPTSALANLGQIHTGKTPPTKLPDMFGGEIPFATPGDLDGTLATTERTLTRQGAEHIRVVRAGSALVGCIGNIGKMAKTPVRCAFNQQINSVEWNERIHDDYGIAALAFTIPQMIALSSSTTVPILNKSGFMKVELRVPPIALQQEFARRVGAVEKLKAAQRTALAEQDALFATLQHRAFRGEL